MTAQVHFNFCLNINSNILNLIILYETYWHNLLNLHILVENTPKIANLTTITSNIQNKPKAISKINILIIF